MTAKAKKTPAAKASAPSNDVLAAAITNNARFIEGFMEQAEAGDAALSKKIDDLQGQIDALSAQHSLTQLRATNAYSAAIRNHVDIDDFRDDLTHLQRLVNAEPEASLCWRVRDWFASL